MSENHRYKINLTAVATVVSFTKAERTRLLKDPRVLDVLAPIHADAMLEGAAVGHADGCRDTEWSQEQAADMVARKCRALEYTEHYIRSLDLAGWIDVERARAESRVKS